MSEETANTAARAEALIREIREGNLGRYPDVQKQLMAITLSEKEFSSEIMFRWYETIRVVSVEDFCTRASTRMMVSMTSYPGRITYTTEALKHIYSQSRKADEIQLWLAEEQFPGKEADLPETLLQQVNEGRVEIRWCEDLKSHKKYFYALQENTDGVTVTVDDDLIYPPEMLEMLYLSWLRHPKAISAMRTHYMAISEKGEILPYKYWIKETDARIDFPDMLLFATTGAGTLYPAGIIREEWFDKKAIHDTCLMADDLWMKAAETILEVPVVQACRSRGLKYVPGSQDENLWAKNCEGNDIQLRKIQDWISEKIGPQVLKQRLLSAGRGIAEYAYYASSETDKLRTKLKQTYVEKSALNRENNELKKSIKTVMTEKDQLATELDRIHRSVPYRAWRKMVSPIRKIAGKRTIRTAKGKCE